MSQEPFLLHHSLLRAAHRFPERVAVVSNGQHHVYADLARAALGLAGTLRECGIQPGDRVVTMLENGPEAVIGLFGTLLAGAVAVPVNPQIRAPRLEFILRDSEATALLAHQERGEWWLPALARRPVRCRVLVQQADAEPLPSDAVGFAAACAARQTPLAETRIDTELAMLIYTSGSTGTPKAVMLSHANMLSAGRSIQAYLGYEASDVILGSLPMSFDYGLYQVLLATAVGAAVAFDRGITFPGRLLRLIESEGVSVIPGVPTSFALLLGMPSLATLDLSKVRLLTNTAAALSERMIRELRAAFPRAKLYSMYGLTECKRVSYLPPEQLDARPASIGRGMPNQAIWLIDEAGRRLPNGQTGELVVTGTHVMLGYWRRPDETRACLSIDEHGSRTLRTGDIFRSDTEGYLYFVGRRDDIIKCRGQKVSPREVENIIGELAGVAEVAVVGVPDEVSGEIVKAFVSLRPGARYGADEIVAHCIERLEGYMVPTRVEIRAQLPKGENGKIDKTALASTVRAA